MTTTTPTGDDYVRGETFEEHLRRHGCVLDPGGWAMIVSHHEINELPDPQYNAAAIHDAHDEAHAALNKLRTLIKQACPDDLRNGSATAHAAFTAFGLQQDGIAPNALLLAAADTHKLLADLLLWAGDVTEHHTDGAPDPATAA